MSIASQDVFLNLTTPITVVGSGGGGGGGVTSVSAAVNISTVGTTTGDVEVNLLDALTGISSIAFNGGGVITGISSINGDTYPPSAGAVPESLQLSTLNMSSFVSFNPNGTTTDTRMYTSTLSGFQTLVNSVIGSAGTSNGYLNVGETGTRLGFRNPITDEGSLVFLNAVNTSLSAQNVGILAPSTITIGSAGTTVAVSSLNSYLAFPELRGVSTINGSAYPAPLPNAATFSTLALSTIQTPANVNPGITEQTFNTVIGGMRFQGGSVQATVAGVTISWASAFTTTPTVMTGIAGVAGTIAYAVVSPGEANATFYVSAVGGSGFTPVYYLAIGAA